MYTRHSTFGGEKANAIDCDALWRFTAKTTDTLLLIAVCVYG